MGSSHTAITYSTVLDIPAQHDKTQQLHHQSYCGQEVWQDLQEENTTTEIQGRKLYRMWIFLKEQIAPYDAHEIRTPGYNCGTLKIYPHFFFPVICYLENIYF